MSAAIEHTAPPKTIATSTGVNPLAAATAGTPATTAPVATCEYMVFVSPRSPRKTFSARSPSGLSRGVFAPSMRPRPTWQLGRTPEVPASGSAHDVEVSETTRAAVIDLIAHGRDHEAARTGVQHTREGG